MGRRVSSGVVGGTGLGSLSVVSSTISSTTTDDDITFAPNGTGDVVFESNAFLHDQADLRFGDADSSNYVAMQGPSSVSSNYTLTLPAAVAGTNGFALVSDTSGNLSWSPAGAALTDEIDDSGTNYIPFTTQTQSDGFLTAARVAATTRPLTYQPSTGTLNATLFNETSSIVFKENLNPISEALEKVLSLKAWTFDRKDGSIRNEPGLVAEEVNEILPNLVTKNSKGDPYSISYTRLTAYLLEAIKELNYKLEKVQGK